MTDTPTPDTVLADGTLAEVKLLARPYPERKYYRGGSYWANSPRDFEKATRVYVDEVGESVLENLRDRTGRPVKAYRAAVVEALKHAGLGDHRLAWSRTAGCSCGCSPGFILRSADGKRSVRHEVDHRPVDIYVKVDKGSLGASIARDINIIL